MKLSLLSRLSGLHSNDVFKLIGGNYELEQQVASRYL